MVIKWLKLYVWERAKDLSKLIVTGQLVSSLWISEQLFVREQFILFHFLV